MEIGDLVKLRTASGYGVLVGINTSTATPVVYDVYTKSGIFPFLPSQLEIVSESR